MTSAALMLNIDLMTSASDWTSPVLLPLGPVTVLPIMAASMGFLVPFVFFIILFFVYIMWDVWFSNLKERVGADDNSSVMRNQKRIYYTHPTLMIVPHILIFSGPGEIVVVFRPITTVLVNKKKRRHLGVHHN